MTPRRQTEDPDVVRARERGWGLSKHGRKARAIARALRFHARAVAAGKEPAALLARTAIRKIIDALDAGGIEAGIRACGPERRRGGRA